METNEQDLKNRLTIIDLIRKDMEKIIDFYREETTDFSLLKSNCLDIQKLCDLSNFDCIELIERNNKEEYLKAESSYGIIVFNKYGYVIEEESSYMSGYLDNIERIDLEKYQKFLELNNASADEDDILFVPCWNKDGSYKDWDIEFMLSVARNVKHRFYQKEYDRWVYLVFKDSKLTDIDFMMGEYEHEDICYSTTLLQIYNNVNNSEEYKELSVLNKINMAISLYCDAFIVPPKDYKF